MAVIAFSSTAFFYHSYDNSMKNLWNMKNILVGLMAAASVAMASPISEHGRLSIDGFNVVDKSGNPYILRGMSLFWNQWGGQFFNSSVVSTLAATDGNGWGANLVRVPISDYSVSTAKDMIDNAYNAGIYVIIDNHSHCAHKDQTNAENFFSDVAKYVSEKSYNHVLYEIYNEPVKQECWGATDKDGGGAQTTWSTIKNYAEPVIEKIRQYDDGIVFVGTPNFSAAPDQAFADPITKYSNISYTLHFYASDRGHLNYQYSLLRGKCKDMSVFITEWGTSEASGDGDFNQSLNKDWMSWVESIGVGWANWAIMNKSETSSALASWAGSNGNWSEGELSASGKYVRNLIKNLNAGSSAADVGLVSKNTDCSLLEGGQASVFERTGIVKFDYSFEAEDYLTASNAKEKENNDAMNKTVMTAEDPSKASTLTFTMKNAPGESGAYKFWARVFPTTEGTISYKVGDATGTLKYAPASGKSDLKSLVEIPAEEEFTVTVTWTGSVDLDMFSVTKLTHQDSIDFELITMDEDGNPIVKSSSSKAEEEVKSSQSSGQQGSVVKPDIDPSLNPGTPIVYMQSAVKFSMELQGRKLAIAGLEGQAAFHVMDMQGRVLMKTTVSNGQVDMSRFRAGSYMVQMVSGGAILNKRIVLR